MAIELDCDRQNLYEVERAYYSRDWPKQAKPYLHLEPYFRCWMNPEEIFCGKTVLDIGAGECIYTRLIVDRFQPKSIIACELFRERMLPAVRENSNPLLKAIVGNCFQLPFKTGSFDVVVGSLVLSQLPNLRCAVDEIGRMLKPGGIFVGWEPNPFNPLILYRYLSRPHSGNQFLFWPHTFRPVFEANGFAMSTRFFYAKLPWTRSRILGTCIGVVARKYRDGL